MASAEQSFSFTELETEAARRRDQRSFHVFAESLHSDVRGQIRTLAAGEVHALPHDRWPKHLFIVLGLSGVVDAEVAGRPLVLRALCQLVILPRVACELRARTDAAIEVISFLSMPPGRHDAG